MAQFSIPAAEAKYSTTIEYFRGIDLLNSPSNVDESRSPAAPNMVRDQVGKVRKRMGYTTRTTAPNGGRINGVFFLGEDRLVHAGTSLYKLAGTEWTELAGDMADDLSKGFVFEEKLYLLDGAVYRVYDGETVKPVSESAYVPTIIISRNPDGGGTSYEAQCEVTVKRNTAAVITASAAATSLIPPPTVKGIEIVCETSLTRETIVSRFSTVAVISRKTSSSAPHDE